MQARLLYIQSNEEERHQYLLLLVFCLSSSDIPTLGCLLNIMLALYAFISANTTTDSVLSSIIFNFIIFCSLIIHAFDSFVHSTLIHKLRCLF